MCNLILNLASTKNLWPKQLFQTHALLSPPCSCWGGVNCVTHACWRVGGLKCGPRALCGRLLAELKAYEGKRILGALLLGGGNSNILYFQTYLGKWSILTNIIQRGWNHQLVLVFEADILFCFDPKKNSSWICLNHVGHAVFFSKLGEKSPIV